MHVYFLHYFSSLLAVSLTAFVARVSSLLATSHATETIITITSQVPEKEEPIGLFPGVDEDEDEEDEFLMDGQEHEGADPDTRADGAPASSSRPRSNRQKGKTSEEMRFWIPPFIDVDNLPGPRVTPDGRPISWWKRINKKSLTEEQWDQIRIWRNKCKSKRTKENRTHRINNEASERSGPSNPRHFTVVFLLNSRCIFSVWRDLLIDQRASL